MQHILTSAVDIVRRAGDFSQKRLHAHHRVQKKGHGDLVTDIDLQVNDMIQDALTGQFPEFAVLSEESGLRRGSGEEKTWVLDPIDGSKHYAIGNPVYGISLALREKRDYLLGVVYFPATGEMYTALKDEGAFLNGGRIRIGTTADLKRAIVCAEIPSRHDDETVLARGMERLKRLIRHTLRVRIVGISSMGMCYCAAGKFDAYINFGTFTSEWDTAGGEIVMQEAGGRIARVDDLIIAAPAALHARLLELYPPTT